MIYQFLHQMFYLLFRHVFGARAFYAERVPKTGGVILAANHLSNWDPPLLATRLERPVSYMAKEELFAVPLLGSIISRCHSFPVKRGSGDRGAIKTAVQVLKKGYCLGLFPEGTRSKDGKLHKPEAGVALIAAMTGAPVVPAAIIGTNHIFSSTGWFPRLKVIYGMPLVFQGNRKNRDELQAFSQEIMDEIARLIAAHEEK